MCTLPEGVIIMMVVVINNIHKMRMKVMMTILVADTVLVYSAFLPTFLGSNCISFLLGTISLSICTHICTYMSKRLAKQWPSDSRQTNLSFRNLCFCKFAFKDIEREKKMFSFFSGVTKLRL